MLLNSRRSNQQIVGLGLDNIMYAMHDAVLVASKDKAQSVKKVVDLLKEMNVSQAKFFLKITDHGVGSKVLFLQNNFK